MNLNNIKSLFSAALLLMAAGTFTTSCVKDLDVDPINPQQTMEADYDALFNKIYARIRSTRSRRWRQTMTLCSIRSMPVLH